MRISLWPDRLELPTRGEALVVRVLVTAARAAARREAHAVLRELLAAWDEPVETSLSYSSSEAWIGVIRGGQIGVDVMRVESFAEADDVAQLYLGPRTAENIRNAVDPARAFALAWTAREATLKCAKRGLSEWTGEELPAITESVSIGDQVVGAVACLLE